LGSKKRMVYNGTTEGNWNGKFIYIEARNSVIDYVIVNENICNKVLDFKVEGRMDSDYLPMCLMINKNKEETAEEKENTKDKKRRGKKKEIIVWDEEAKKNFREKTETLRSVEEQEAWTIEERRQWIKGVVNKAMIKKRECI